MKQYLLLLFIAVTIQVSAQVPFAHKTKFRNISKEEMQDKVEKSGVNNIYFPAVNALHTDLNVASPDRADSLQATADDYNKESKIKEKKPDLFSQFSGGLVIGDDVNTLFPTVNGDIITYRLNLWSRIKVDTIENGKARNGKVKNTTLNRISREKRSTIIVRDTIRHYVPLSIISKVSGSNQNNTGTMNDAVSFFGAPLTFRISPNLYDLEFGENRFVIGMHHDLRLIAIGDTNTNKIDAGFGYYGAFGFSYFGIGDASISTNPTVKEDGQWSFSSLVYFFKSGGKFNKAVFGDYVNKSLTGFELLLRFKTNSASAGAKFNLMLGANYGLTRGAPNFAKWEFRLGVGN